MERNRFGPRRHIVLLTDAGPCWSLAYAEAEDIGTEPLVRRRRLTCREYAKECPGNRPSTKVRRESQSRLVHPSKLRVSSLGQTKVELAEGVVRPCVHKRAVSTRHLE